jgi:hypothetical protein
MSENWVVQPDATSEYILVPADADVESWQHNVVTANGSGLPDVNVNEVGDTSQTAGDLAALITTVDTVVDGIQTDLDNGTDGLGALKVLIDAVQTDLDNGTDGLGALKTLIDGLNDLSAAAVNAEMVDVLVTDTYAEPAQGTPAATASIKDKVGYLYKFLRNRVTSDATTISVYNDDAVTVDHKAAHSDDATTYDRGEFTTGP